MTYGGMYYGIYAQEVTDDLIDRIRKNESPSILLITELHPNLRSQFVEAFKSNTSTKELRFRHFTPKDDIGGVIGDIIQANKTLDAIDAVECGIDEIGAKKIAKGLRGNTALRELDICSLHDVFSEYERNCIGNGGFTALAMASNSSNLSVLDVRGWHNQIDDDGAGRAASHFKNNHQLTELRIGQGHYTCPYMINTPGTNDLLRAFQNSKNIVYVEGSPELETAFSELCRTNRMAAHELIDKMLEGIDNLTHADIQEMRERRPAIMAVARHNEKNGERDIDQLNAILDKILEPDIAADTTMVSRVAKGQQPRRLA